MSLSDLTQVIPTGSGGGGEGDAETLDGHIASYFLDRTNHTGTRSLFDITDPQFGSGDAASIAAALAAAAVTKGIVYVPPGDYEVTLTDHPDDANYKVGLVIPSGVHLMGAGRDATTIRLAAGSVGITETQAAWIIGNDELGGGSHSITISDLTVDGDGANQTVPQHGIVFLRHRHGRIRNVRVRDTKGLGGSGSDESFCFESQLSSDIVYATCEAEGTGPGYTASGFSTNGSVGVTYTDCRSRGLTYNGFTHNGCRNLLYTACWAYLCGTHGYNSEVSDAVTFLGCVSGGRVGAVATVPYTPDQSLGNANGFVFNGSTNVIVHGCCGESNTAGTGLFGLGGSSGRVVGGSFRLNAYGISFIGGDEANWRVFSPVAADNTTANIQSPALSGVAGSDIANTPAGGIAATTVQAAVNELDTEKAPIASPTFTGTPTVPVLVVTGLTGAGQTSRYAGATTTGAPSSGTFSTGDFVVARDGGIWVCTTGGTPGTWGAVGGGSGGGSDAATLNAQPGSYYLARGNHTGTQTASTVSDLTEAVQDIVGAFTSGTGGVTATYSDASNTLVLSIGDGALGLPKLATQAAGTVVANTTGSTASPIAVAISTTLKTALTLAKADVGLGNADNTSDANKPVSTATSTALGGKVDTTRTITAGTGLSGGGDLSANRTLAVTDDTSIQKHEVSQSGTLVGTRKRLNLIPGTNVSISSADSSVNNRVDVTISATGAGGASTLDGLTDVTVSGPSGGQVLVYDAGSGQWENGSTSAGTAWNVLVQVTADGATDVSASIQSVLDALASSSHSFEVIVEGATKGVIYLNNKVRISTDNTKVRFLAPVKLGTGIDPDGFGGLSIRGSVASTTTASSGATRGSSQIVVASATNLTPGRLIRVFDTDTTGGASAGYKQEMAQVIHAVGTTIYLDHALHHTYTGTISVEAVNAVTNSGFEDVSATFSGTQSAAFLFPAKMQYTRDCYFRNMRFKGSTTNSWSREGFSLRYSYRCSVERCEASLAWNYTVGSTYSYGFSADGATECTWDRCYASNLRHGFSADKGTAGCIYTACISDNVTASGFDLHGNWCRDITYTGCRADSSETLSAADGQRVGFLSGNTTFINGCQNITYTGCVARNFKTYTRSGGGAGDGAGFGVVDGCSNITFDACRVYDCEMGVYILSEIGQPISNIGIYNCEFSNITSAASANLPIYVHAGVSPQDVNGFIIDGCRFVAGNAMASIRLYGTSGNTVADFVVTNCTFNRSTFTSGVWAVDARFVDNLVVNNNVFNRTNRGVYLQSCVSASVVFNVFQSLVNGSDAKDTFNDAGGNTNMVFAKNLLVGYQPTSNTVAITSTGAYVEMMSGKQVYTTATRPSATISRAGASYFDTTLNKPAWSDGTNWRDAAGATV